MRYYSVYYCIIIIVSKYHIFKLQFKWVFPYPYLSEMDSINGTIKNQY